MLSVVAGMSVGIVLVIVFASMPVTDDNSFSPESYYDWSPEDGGLPLVVLTVSEGDSFYSHPPEEIIVMLEDHDDVDGCCDQIDSITFDHELKLTIEENDH